MRQITRDIYKINAEESLAEDLLRRISEMDHHNLVEI